jgi:hypothetical protein
MFFEMLLTDVTVIIVASLVFARYTLERQDHLDNPKVKDPTIEEKRRVLERQREGFYATLRSNITSDMRHNLTKYILKIDEQLLALADEEARSRGSNKDPMPR